MQCIQTNQLYIIFNTQKSLKFADSDYSCDNDVTPQPASKSGNYEFDSRIMGSDANIAAARYIFFTVYVFFPLHTCLSLTLRWAIDLPSQHIYHLSYLEEIIKEPK
jgi:hypothetical protein